MRSDVQAVLAKAADYLRLRRLQGSDTLEQEYAHAEGVVAGLHNVKLITSEEHGEWLKRMHEAAALEWAGDDAWEPDVPSDLLNPGTAPKLIRFLVGGRESKPLLDGEAVVPLVELLEDRVIVWWRIAPLPSPMAVFGDELRMLQRDIEGLATEDPGTTFWIDHSYEARLSYLAGVTVEDDLGTRYRPSGGGSTGSFQTGALSGHARCHPATPSAATALTVRLGSVVFRFPL